MKSVRFVLAAVLMLVLLNHVPVSAAQQGQGSWAGGSAGSWPSANSQYGQPGSNGGQASYGYGGVDANGVPYGGYGGNGGYFVNVTDEHGRQHSYSGGQGGFGGQPGQPGQPGHPGQSAQPGYPGTFSYDNTNTNRNGRPYSSSSAYASAWSTFYLICLFSLLLIIKS